MMRYASLVAATGLLAASQTASAQGGRHPLIGTWQVQYAGPVATASEPVAGPLTIEERGGRLIATLLTPSACATARSSVRNCA